MLPKFILIEEEVSLGRVFACHSDDLLEKIFRDIFELENASEIEGSTRISQVVVNFSIDIEDSHEIVMFLAGQSDLMNR